MTNECTGVVVLDPVQGFIDYVNDVKPYHTKIIDVLIEYVYTERVNVSFEEATEWDIVFEYPAIPTITFSCEDGYSLRPFGGPGAYPILNPNQNGLNTRFYYGFDADTNSFSVPGDRANNFLPGATVSVASFVEDYSYLYLIDDVNPGPAGTGSFVVIDPAGDFEDNHPIYNPTGSPNASAETIQTVGAPRDDNRTFTVTNVQTNTPSAGKTTVSVAQAVLSDVPAGRLGIVKYPANNTGIYTVVSAEYNGGTIDSWPGYPSTEPPNYALGDDPHTIVTVAENIITPDFAVDFPGESPEQKTYYAVVTLSPLVIEKVYSYSNFPPTYTAGTPADYENTPDEGISRRNIVGVMTSTLDGFGNPISGTGELVVSGNWDVSNVFVGDIITVRESSGNNGTYEIASISYDLGADQTTLGIVGLIDDAIADGYVEIDIPSNVFIVSGNQVDRFNQGELFIVTTGTYAGQYTTLSSDFIGGKTRIRTTTDIISTGGVVGYDILDTTTGFIVGGDKTSVYTPGSTVNVYQSFGNDGSYTVDTSTYVVTSGSPLASYTIIVPVEPFTENLGEGGKLILSTHGYIGEKIYGFGETSDFCSFNPEGIVRVQIGERLIISGGTGFDFRDDIIVYNMENNDEWGFELPIKTMFSNTEPTILEGTVFPQSAAFNDLFYNTDTGILYRWDTCTLGGSPPECLDGNPPGSPNDWWREIKTAYWLDTSTNLLYYRTRFAQPDDSNPTVVRNDVDTGWIQYFAEPPGYSLSQPAVAETILVGKEEFTVDDLSDVTFTFRTTTQNIDDVDVYNQSFITNGDVRNDFYGMYLEVGDRPLVVSGSQGSPIGSPLSNDGVYTVLQVTYDSINDATRITVAEPIPTAVAGGTYTIGPLSLPGSPADATLLRVYINNVPADFILDGSTTFTLVAPPQWSVDDIIRAEVYERSGAETNAHVNAYSIAPHLKYHSNVTPYEGSPSQAYVLPGGNYIDRFAEYTVYQGYSIGLGGALLVEEQASLFNITDWSRPDRTITISGDYAWLFTTNREVGVLLSDDIVEYFTIISSELVGGSPAGSPIETVITLADNNTGSGSPVGSPLPDSNLWDTLPFQGLAFVVGAVYDPVVDSSNPADQPKTYLVPETGVVNPAVEGITYDWVGPVRIHTQAAYGNQYMAIIEADATLNRFGVAGDYTSLFTPNQSVTIEGSVGNDDRTWIIQRSYYNGAGAVNIVDIRPVGSPAGSPIEYAFVIDGFQSDKFVTGFSFSVTNPNPLPPGSPAYQTPAGNYLTASSEYDAGNDQTIIRVAPITPIPTDQYTTELLSFSGTDRTYIYVQERPGSPNSYINETEPYGAIYLGDINNNNTVLDDVINTASATFTERFSFSWGSDYRWSIIETNPDSIVIGGDVTGIVLLANDPNDPNDTITIEQSRDGVNDGDYELASVSYNPVTGRTTIYLASGSPIRDLEDGSPFGSPLGASLTTEVGSPAVDPSGYFVLRNIDITNWFQYPIRLMNYGSEEITVSGNATGDIQSGQKIKVHGNINAGAFTVTSSPNYDPSSGSTTFPVASDRPTTSPPKNIIAREATILDVLTPDSILVEGIINVLDGQDYFAIVGSSQNDGDYYVQGAQHDTGNTIINILEGDGEFAFDIASVGGSIQFFEKGGFVESYRDYGVHLRFTDSIGVSTTEEREETIILAGDIFVGDFGGFDNTAFDLNTLDEDFELRNFIPTGDWNNTAFSYDSEDDSVIIIPLKPFGSPFE